ncbi:hypothetical protein N2152v2_004080 [Parachlorella kessleri]
MSAIRLPRASTRAFELLRQSQPQQDDSQTAAQQPECTSDTPDLLAFIQQLRGKDVRGVLSPAAPSTSAAGQPAASLGQLEASIQAGQGSLPWLAEQFRALCDGVISTNFYSNRKLAQEASDLLDYGNALLQELEPSAQAVQRSQQADKAAAGAPQLPAETFFLPARQVAGCLTLAVDESLVARAGRARRQAGGGGGGGGGGSSRRFYGLGTDSEAGDSEGTRSGATAAKRRRMDSQGPGAAKRKARKSADPWTPELQAQIALVLMEILQPAESGAGSSSVPKELREFAKELKSSQAAEQMRAVGTTLQKPCATLQVGGYLEPEELVADVSQECREAVETYVVAENPGVRRGKITGWAEAFTSLLASSLEAMLGVLRAGAAGTAGRGGTSRRAAATASGAAAGNDDGLLAFQGDLPPSIQANREPYKHGDWRKTPYAPRPYIRLQEYDIVEPQLQPSIKKKLATRKQGGCDGQHCQSREQLGRFSLEREGFDTACPCLSHNTECDAHCGCQGADNCLNRAVSQRRTLELGVDVKEINSWGIDCYTRRNIRDAVLESQALGSYSSPNPDALPPSPAAAALAAATSAASRPSRLQFEGGSNLAEDAQQAHHEGQQAQREPPAQQAPLLAVTSPVTAAALEHAQQQQQQQQQGRDTGQRRAGGGAAVNAGKEVGVQAQQQLRHGPQAAGVVSLEQQATDWIERTLLPAINRQASGTLPGWKAIGVGDNGWDILVALQEVKAAAQAAGDSASLKAATAVEARVKEVGYNYFRVHPKGVGLVCMREAGLAPLTFVEEYLGEIHTPWRWFEIQDVVKRITGDELPDFYNIQLERPRDDPDGYDVLNIDAASKGAFASRMSHSCTPNCQAVVMACSGRLTIAVYTLRHVYPGEELTFDYAVVSESEKEFKEAICLCSTHLCRGSYLTFTGSRGFMQIMSTRHNFLHRQAIIARAGCEPLTDADRQRLDAHGLRNSCLGGGCFGPRLPDWVLKWAALVCEFIELEEACLQRELMANPLGLYTEASAAAEARGVLNNRLQNVAITLDKVKMVLRSGRGGGQPQGPCLRLLPDAEVVAHLWAGPKSIAKRVLKGVLSVPGLAAGAGKELVAATTDAEWAAALEAAAAGELPPAVVALCRLVLRPAGSAQEARQGLLDMVAALRKLDVQRGGGLTACADILFLYASTKRWMTAERGYKAVTSPPVPINLADLTLDRTKGSGPAAAPTADKANGLAPLPPPQQQQQQLGQALHAAAAASGSDERPPQQQQQGRPPSRVSLTSLAESGGGTVTTGGGEGLEGASAPGSARPGAGAANGPSSRQNMSSGGGSSSSSSLCKSYRPLYVWGQLSGWFKQTVNDPTASLSAERRGTLSLPDVESCFAGGKGKYTAKERGDMLEHVERRPDSMWRIGTQWSFKNEAKVYGSPMLDAVWEEMLGGPPSAQALAPLLSALRTAEVPFRGPTPGWAGGEALSGGSGKAAGPRNKRAKAQQQ